MINFRLLKLSDKQLWLAVGLLVLIGFLSIFSATYQMQVRLDLDPFLFVKRQFVSLLIAFLGLSIFTYFDYRHWQKTALYFYGFTLILLAVILFSGSSAQGAQRWLQLGPVSFQPSEISKLTMIIALAACLADRFRLNQLRDSGRLLVLAALPFGLVFKQPDLGTALVYIALLLGIIMATDVSPKLLIILITPIISLGLRPVISLWLIYILAVAAALFLSRARTWDWALILGSNILVGIALPFLWLLLKAYQRQRILAFLNPAADPYGAGYHSLQSMIAVGGGGFFGKGFLHGTQTQLQFIPEQHSDFIFSVVAEEFGFLGAVMVVGLFALVIWRALLIARQASDLFGRLLAAGVAVMLSFHVLANIGMVLGILPVVGIPLPFLSFGGTSLLVSLSAIGLLQSIAMRRQKIIF